MINKYSVLTPSIGQRQSGVVLVMSLIILLALTLIGVTSSRVTSLEEKMAANSKDKNLAFQAAETTLRFVESSLATKPEFNYAASYSAQGQDGLYTLIDSAGSPKSDSTEPFYDTVDWESTANVATYSNVTSGGKKLVGLSRPPVYIIEEISSKPLESAEIKGGSVEGGTSTMMSQGELVTFRITAHGWGSNNSVAIVQSIFKVTYQ